MHTNRLPTFGRSLPTRRWLVILLTATLLPSVVVAERQTPILERDLTVVSDPATGTFSATLIGSDRQQLGDWADAQVEIVARFDAPPAAQEGPTPILQIDGSRHAPSKPEIALEIDLTGFAAPAGATGFDVFVRGGRPGRKPLSWLVINHYYTGGNQIGIEAITRCHAGYMWTFFATWTNLFHNHTNCPSHGFQLNSPGSSTQIQTQFDGAYLTRYRTWQGSSSQTWTFYPSGGGL